MIFARDTWLYISPTTFFGHPLDTDVVTFSGWLLPLSCEYSIAMKSFHDLWVLNFQKNIGCICHSRWYQYEKIGCLAHGLLCNCAVDTALCCRHISTWRRRMLGVWQTLLISWHLVDIVMCCVVCRWQSTYIMTLPSAPSWNRESVFWCLLVAPRGENFLDIM